MIPLECEWIVLCQLRRFTILVSNLKKVVESIIDYYVEVLNITLNDFTRPDVLKIAEKYDRAELGHLLQMILGNVFNIKNDITSAKN